jgi:pimeloyl-ACP methyl ester carboxylesterase
MPKITANTITMNYEQQGTGEPLILIPYLSGDNTCYAFQVAEYAKYFTCISIDLRGTGESDKPQDAYTTETLADDVAAFMDAAGISKAHVAGLSLGAGIGLWIGAKYPHKVQSLSLHSCWTKTDAFLKAVVESWQLVAQTVGVQEMVIRSIFPWCLTPELYRDKPDFIESLAAFVRSRPPQTVPDFLRQSDAALTHDVESHLSRVIAPTQITFGRHDQITSTRFAERLTSGIRGSELVIFEDCSHAPIYENVEEFNQKTLAFLQRHAAPTASAGL